jgi:hypothetical protein
VRSPVAIFTSLCLALALGGCSLTQAKTTTPKGASGPAKAIGAVITSFSTDAADNDASTICSSILATSLEQRLNKIGGCSKIITNQLPTATNDNLTITKYGVSGNSAIALVKSLDNGSNRLYTIHLVKQANGGWRISSVS